MFSNKKNELTYFTTLDLSLPTAQHLAIPPTDLPMNKHWFQDRLKQIKVSQRQLAKRMKLDPAAVTYMFQGKRAMSMDEAKSIADILMVPVTEVMRQAGIEVMDDVRKVPIAGYVGPGGSVTLMPKGTHDMVMAPADVPSGAFALQYRIINAPVDGWLVFVSGQHEKPEDLLGKLTMSALKDGRLVEAIVRRGYKSGLYNLMTMPDQSVLENQEIAWSSRVVWIQPS